MPNGLLVIHAIDDMSGDVTPVRMEVISSDQIEAIALSGLTVQQECPGSVLPNFLGSKALGFSYRNYIANPHTGTKQFYVDKVTELNLHPGEYKIRAFKGIEFKVASQTVTVAPGNRQEITLRMERLTNLPQSGWYSADDHLHISRRNSRENPNLLSWMKAEDINVSNFLQVGTEKGFKSNQQYAFGDEGIYQDGNYFLTSGQENPRTHFLGHTITLGAAEKIDLNKSYTDYQSFWREAKRLGGISGYGHWGLGPAKRGIAIDAPSRLLTFVEVLQFEYAHYNVWYDVLNMGIPMTPTAGTDFPCGPWSIPGRERFYTKVEGKFNLKNWIEGVKKGRTFVTNGPLLEFKVNGRELGDEIVLQEPGILEIDGSVSFDPERDQIEKIELVNSGEIIPLLPHHSSMGKIFIHHQLKASRTSWLALRVSGKKINEAPLEAQPFKDWQYRIGGKVNDGVDMQPRERFAKANNVRPSVAHTAPIYISVMTPTSVDDNKIKTAKDYLRILAHVKYLLNDKNISSNRLPLGFLNNSDSVSVKNLKQNREQILEAVKQSEIFYQGLMKSNSNEHHHNH